MNTTKNESARNNKLANVPETVAPETVNIPWQAMSMTFLGVFTVFAVFRAYQHWAGFKYGLDAFDPVFQTYWMNVMYVELPLVCVLGTGLLAWIWFTREKEKVLQISRREEISRYMTLIGFFSVFALVAYLAASVYTEADAAWHQVTVRDTDFTPTHIPLFYFAIPMMIFSGSALFLWAHTRLPDYYGRVSVAFALAIGGPILIMPNLGYNEWGHTFFYAEELFSAPVHWGFVLLGWAFFFAGGMFMQILRRVTDLTHVPEEVAAVVRV